MHLHPSIDRAGSGSGDDGLRNFTRLYFWYGRVRCKQQKITMPKSGSEERGNMKQNTCYSRLHAWRGLCVRAFYFSFFVVKVHLSVAFFGRPFGVSLRNTRLLDHVLLPEPGLPSRRPGSFLVQSLLKCSAATKRKGTGGWVDGIAVQITHRKADSIDRKVGACC